MTRLPQTCEPAISEALMNSFHDKLDKLEKRVDKLENEQQLHHGSLHTPSTSTSEESYEPPSSVDPPRKRRLRSCSQDSANKKLKVEGVYSERCNSCILTKHFPRLGAKLPSRIDLGSLLDGSTVDVSAVAEGSHQCDAREVIEIKDDTGSTTVFIESTPGELLPAAQQGDCVLLQNFVVGSIDGSLCLLSQEGSSWCIIRQGYCSRGIGGIVREGK